jgi:hypothetical protein
MRYLLTILLLVAFTLPTQAAFQKFTYTRVAFHRDSSGVQDGIILQGEIWDTAIPEAKQFTYVIQGAEFASLPAGAAAKKTAIVAITKREVQKAWVDWASEYVARPKPPQERDAQADLGVTEFATFAGAAAPLPTPTP